MKLFDFMVICIIFITIALAVTREWYCLKYLFTPASEVPKICFNS